jgi:hypothetical protein
MPGIRTHADWHSRATNIDFGMTSGPRVDIMGSDTRPSPSHTNATNSVTVRFPERIATLVFLLFCHPCIHWPPLPSAYPILLDGLIARTDHNHSNKIKQVGFIINSFARLLVM